MSAHTILFLKRILPPFSCCLPSKYSFSSTSKLSAVKSPNDPQTEAAEDCRRRRKTVMTQFFLNDCGLSDSQVLALRRRNEDLYKSESIRRARQAVQFFRDSGFTEEQVRKIVFQQPSILHLKVDTQLNPKIEFLRALGFTGSNLGHMVPGLLTCSLEHCLSPKISMLVGVFGSELNLCKILMNNPRFLMFKFDNLKLKIDILKQSGMQDELLSHVFSRRPYLILGIEEALKLKIEYVRNLGILEGSKVFANALAVIDSSGLENFKKKLKHVATLGLSEDETLEIVRKYPNVFALALIS